MRNRTKRRMFLFDSKRGNGACLRSVPAHDGISTEMAASSGSPFAANDKYDRRTSPLSRRRTHTAEARGNKRRLTVV